MDKSGIAEDLMTDLSKLFGKTRGGLAIAIVFIGVLLVFCFLVLLAFWFI